jgi:Protein of unknown function (DUF1269)
MKQLAESIHPGDAALFVLIKEMTADKVVEQIKDYGGVVLKTSLTDAKEQALRDARQRRGVRCGRACGGPPILTAPGVETSRRRRCRLDEWFGSAGGNALFNSRNHVREEGV